MLREIRGLQVEIHFPLALDPQSLDTLVLPSAPSILQYELHSSQTPSLFLQQGQVLPIL